MATRTLGIIRRKSLSDVADGWDDCFITYRPASIGELKGLSQVKNDGMSEAEAINYMLTFVKSHVVGGKIRILGNDSSAPTALVDIEPDDVDNLPQDVITSLLSDISGAKLDPKGTQPAAGIVSGPPSDDAPTAT